VESKAVSMVYVNLDFVHKIDVCMNENLPLKYFRAYFFLKCYNLMTWKQSKLQDFRLLWRLCWRLNCSVISRVVDWGLTNTLKYNCTFLHPSVSSIPSRITTRGKVRYHYLKSSSLDFIRSQLNPIRFLVIYCFVAYFLYILPHTANLKYYFPFKYFD
jgi:hypothetical protein